MKGPGAMDILLESVLESVLLCVKANNLVGLSLGYYLSQF